MNLVSGDLATEMLKTYDLRATTVIGGFNATWNDWAFQALSNQSIAIKNQRYNRLHC